MRKHSQSVSDGIDWNVRHRKAGCINALANTPSRAARPGLLNRGGRDVFRPIRPTLGRDHHTGRLATAL